MIRALVVDDDERIIESIRDTLDSVGHGCDAATHQEQARELLSCNRYDYVLLDLHIPVRYGGVTLEQYGKNLLREIVRMPDAPPVIIITAFGSGDLAIEMVEKRAFSYVDKPFKPGKLEEKIEAALSSRGRGPARGGAGQSPPEPFAGGELVLRAGAIELCGIRVGGTRSDSLIRGIVELLGQKDQRGRHVVMSGTQLVRALQERSKGREIRGQNAIAEAVKDFRDACTERMREARGQQCARDQVIANNRRGYHIADGIDMRLDTGVADRKATEVEKDAEDVLREMRATRKRTRRQLDDKLGIPLKRLRAAIALLETRKLIESKGNGQAAYYILKDEPEVSTPAPAPDTAPPPPARSARGGRPSGKAGPAS